MQGSHLILNRLVERNISAVSNKRNTTDEAVSGIFTDLNSKS